MAEEYDYLFKSIVVGDGGVGKTALTLRFSKGFFTEDYKMTIGVDFHVKTISIDSSEGLIRSKLQIWDTGGQERFSSIRPMYYRGSLGALLIFDLTNSASFEHLPQWIEEVRANVKNEIPLLLVGNKSDLLDEREVTLEELNNFTRDFNLFYMETSAKTGDGVGDCFYILACLMIGSGVPDQLVSSGKVFNPGEIANMVNKGIQPSSPQVQPEYEYSAPPVPEPTIVGNQNQEFSFEPDPEIEYEAPPVPEPTFIKQPSSNPPFSSEFEPEIPIPEPLVEESGNSSPNFDFKTPEEILSEEKSETIENSNVAAPVSTYEETYKPKAAPFTSNIPVPAPPPEGFQAPQEDSIVEAKSDLKPLFSVPTGESHSRVEPFIVSEPIFSKKDKKKQDKQKKKEEREIKLQKEREEKERKLQEEKEEKERKLQEEKEEKERKLQEEKERQKKLIEEMKKAKKEKKQKPKKEKSKQLDIATTHLPPTVSPHDSLRSPSLFQTLAQKGDEEENSQTSSFIPFSSPKESKNQEISKLRIIPNVNGVDTHLRKFTPITPQPTTQKKPKSGKKDLIICKNCGGILSSDYAFCNKCGSQL
ncbi:hypothetical protein LCGC14_0681700 [marine sediment metagenome]|uniref:GTP-binding protein n=1 Tax=marine sediment metagenome TaxID=412755 RepID=A0A0F9QN11_9ZZZZ|nr:MAG: small GTP-binding domain protein [Candidatus Lokiarchaeum sp. GC14_75]